MMSSRPVVVLGYLFEMLVRRNSAARIQGGRPSRLWHSFRKVQLGQMVRIGQERRIGRAGEHIGLGMDFPDLEDHPQYH